MKHVGALAVACGIAAVLALAGSAQTAAPIVVVETTKGTFEIQTYPREAPATVAHVTELIKKGFYDGQRVHRALPGFVVQWGDPRSRDLSKEADWGLGSEAGSGTPVGVAEISEKLRHHAGAVGLAHPGAAAKADSQIYVTLANRPDLDDRYALFGMVTDGADVPARLQRGDQILRMYLK